MKNKTLIKNIGIFFAIALLYYFLAFPFAKIEIIYGVVDARLSGVVPVAAGLLFGPLGAFACAFGNFLIDLGANFDIIDVFGVIGSFLMAYLPYKLWHSLFMSSGNKKPEFLGSVSSVIKCVIIVAVASTCGAIVPSIPREFLNEGRFGEFFFGVAFQYFNLSIIAGIFIFQLLTEYVKIKPHIPKKMYAQEYNAKNYIIDYILLIALMVIVTTLFLGSGGTDGDISTHENGVLILILIIIFLLAVLPMRRKGKPLDVVADYKPLGGIRKQIITGVFAIMCISLGIYAIDVLWGRTDYALLWEYELIRVALVSVLLLVALCIVLQRMEVKIITPLYTLTKYAKSFAENNEAPKLDASVQSLDNEVGYLSNSITDMIAEIRDNEEKLRNKAIEEAHLATEMSVAHEIQMKMLPHTWEGETFDIAAQIKPAKEVGGDFYDFFRLSESKVFFAIADVSGKGVSAGLFMVRAKTFLAMYREKPLSDMVEKLNEELSFNNTSMMFVTLFVGVVDYENLTLTYINAGHNPPVLYTNNKPTFLSEKPDFVVGAIGNMKYHEHTVALNKDFKLLMYTDGVTEAQDKNGDFFGDDKLLQISQQIFSTDADARRNVDEIEAQVSQFSQGAVQSDDITLLFISGKQHEKTNI